MPLLSRWIQLTKGKQTLVDGEDYEKLTTHKWKARLGEDGYWRAVHTTLGTMSRLILGVTDPTTYVDHKNHDTLDNRKSNLRKCTPTQNQQNQKKRDDNTSGYKGVYKRKDLKLRPWIARISVDGVRIDLGKFATVEEAAIAYKEAALKYHGEFACLGT